MSTSQLQFSIIIPTYHRNDQLEACLDCLATSKQSLSQAQYEVIVSDDGIDTTARDLVHDKYPWVKWVDGPRKGPAANRNNGAAHASGTWLVFADDDCLPEREWLLSYASAIVSDILVYEGKTTCKAGVDSPMQHSPVNEDGGFLWSCNMMIQRKFFLQELVGFDENFPYPQMEDVDLRERIKKTDCPHIRFVKDAVVDHPPKRVPWGDKLANLHESYIYWYCKNETVPSKNYLFNLTIKNILKFRLAAILHCRISFDSLLALISMLVELLNVVLKFRGWIQKYNLGK
jgi:GT2 family glycosyltransferase